MIQDIFPHKFDNSYKHHKPDDDSEIYIFCGNKVCLEENNGKYKMITYRSLKKVDKLIDEKLIYLFKIDKKKFYLLNDISLLEKNLLILKDCNIFKELKEEYSMFAGFTAMHLYKWYSSNKYCGRCGYSTKQEEIERALSCSNCNNKIYPTISPVIMVGIINNDKILLTKYANRNYKSYTLPAGFVEIGETLEDAVKREVMEEVGLKVKNIRYYKSQPWALSSSLITGFYAELEESNDVTLDHEELAEAKWFKYDEVPLVESIVGLSDDMILEFKKTLTK